VTRDQSHLVRLLLDRPKNRAATDFDPFSAQIMHDPYPGYQSLLTGTEVPGVWYNRKRGIWIIAGYDDVRKALRDNEELSSAQSQSRFRVFLPSMNAADPPEHTRLRKFVSRAFHRSRDDGLADEHQRSRRRARRQRDRPGPHRGGHRTRQTAADPADRQDARHPAAGINRSSLAWSDDMVAGAFAPLTPHGIRLSARSGSATAAMRRSLDPLIAQRRLNPGDDLISMMTPADADDVLTDDEIFWSAAMLIGAGSETTTNHVVGGCC